MMWRERSSAIRSSASERMKSAEAIHLSAQYAVRAVVVIASQRLLPTCFEIFIQVFEFELALITFSIFSPRGNELPPLGDKFKEPLLRQARLLALRIGAL